MRNKEEINKRIFATWINFKNNEVVLVSVVNLVLSVLHRPKNDLIINVEDCLSFVVIFIKALSLKFRLNCKKKLTIYSKRVKYQNFNELCQRLMSFD